MHHDQWMRARDTLLPLAQREAQLETASYAAGRAALPDVIEAEAGLARTEPDMLHREAAVARHQAVTALTYADNQENPTFRPGRRSALRPTPARLFRPDKRTAGAPFTAPPQ